MLAEKRRDFQWTNQWTGVDKSGGRGDFGKSQGTIIGGQGGPRKRPVQQAENEKALLFG